MGFRRLFVLARCPPVSFQALLTSISPSLSLAYSSLKLKRAVAAKRYRADLDRLYAEGDLLASAAAADNNASANDDPAAAAAAGFRKSKL